jgi:hypothetical protein
MNKFDQESVTFATIRQLVLWYTNTASKVSIQAISFGYSVIKLFDARLKQQNVNSTRNSWQFQDVALPLTESPMEH